MVKALEEQSLFRLSEERLNSHNQYLNILLISGFTGLLIFFLILLFNAVKLIRDKNIFGFWIELTFILYFMTEASLLRYKGVGLFAIFMVLSHYYASFEYDKGKTAES